MGKSLHFTKMHSCGNDYIYFNCFNQTIESPGELAKKLSRRRTGIGGDGIVMILPSSIADGKMRMFNGPDGSESHMCGNSIRCVAKYLYDNGIAPKTHMRIETGSGIKELYLTAADGKVTAARVNMGPAVLQPDMIPVDLPGESVVSRPVTIGSTVYRITCVSMGNPHAIIFHDDIDHFDLTATGTAFENSDLFPEGINLGIVQTISRNHMRMRVWERGTGETMASGTGACAAAVAAVLMGYADKNSDIKVEVAGGTLTVNYTNLTVYMTGDCVTIYEGVVQI